MEFSLHTYIKRLRAMGADDLFVEAVERRAKPLADTGMPVLLTLGHLAAVTGMPYRFLLAIVQRRIDPYRVFQIRKRGGGRRFICVPETHLLSIQQWIHQFILCSPGALRRISLNSTAYAPGSSHIANAKQHLGATWILKLDVSRFFESISERQVYLVFRRLGYAALVAFCLTRLCTRVVPRERDARLRGRVARWCSSPRRHLSAKLVGHLPQGAPTSPMLANLVCEALDDSLTRVADRENMTYSRYADDMTFSASSARDRDAAAVLIGEITRIVGAQGLGINSKKTSVTKDGSRKIVTGLSVDGEALRLPRSYKDKIRQELYFLGRFGINDHCARIKQASPFSYLLRLVGRIRYVSIVEPRVGNAFMRELEAAFPRVHELEHLVVT